MKVDNEDPIAKCGFTDIALPIKKKGEPLIEVDDNTLFHYTDDKNDESNLESLFFYEIEVSWKSKIMRFYVKNLKIDSPLYV